MQEGRQILSFSLSLETFRGNEPNGRVSDLEGPKETVYSPPITHILPRHPQPSS